MSKPSGGGASILIASDSATHATLVKKLLDDEFERVRMSTHPEAAADDFDRERPQVLVLAFGTLEKAERYNLGLFRQSREIHRQPHRTLVLCSKDELRRAYELCRDELFDDYVLFWPVAHDANRLPMAVHNALRELAGAGPGGAGTQELAGRIKDLAGLEQVLAEGLGGGEAQVAAAAGILDGAAREIQTALHQFLQGLLRGDPRGLVDVLNPAGLAQAFERLEREALAPPLQAIAGSMPPLQAWAAGLRQSSAPHLETLRALQAAGRDLAPTLLVVDDDPYQHKVVEELVRSLGFRVVFASGGLEALNLLRKHEPDLVLIDYSMPDMDGVEVTRRIRGIGRFAGLPIIMITGNSEERVVTESLVAGADDFMVKPLGRDPLLAKIAKVLGPDCLPPGPDLQDVEALDL